MYYLFLDEMYRDTSCGRAIVITAWAARQARVNDRFNVLRDLQKPGTAPIFLRIDSVLATLDGLALISKADLDRSLFKPGERDGTADVLAMARPDTIWSVAVIFSVGYLIKLLMLDSYTVQTVDVFFDPKSLKADHAKALERVLRETLVREARRFSVQKDSNLLRHLHIRRITPVDKPQKDAAPNKFQVGTWISHKLCTKSDEFFRTGSRDRIKTEDISEVVTRTVQQWEGKSFYE